MSRLTGGKLYNTFYYTKDEVSWSTWAAPIIDFKKLKEITPG